ncbi:hypothetical protein BIV57_21275 [Mangrovactinospora gilvigrisea]|uniref:Abasic site processing protein n=1 Tax=Mangrovactinospora gilvigrisea TaxID=1428644 RepID=A0A1J7BA11_9ACTN|nr:SOS response-associated peptidase [Mangrovactinospora gilvigrisea]OIV35527.1 hypothetical protein BIV57_21275 [Mangrovactinospora gilvigrisea]
MCGRYASSAKPEDLVALFGVEYREPEETLAPDWNIAPTKPVWAVLDRPRRDSGSEEPVRQLRVLRWGLVPSWAKDPAIGGKMFNARAETVAEKPAYRRAFARRRCLLPADGYYEWHTYSAAEAKERGVKKQPYFIHTADGSPMAFAGLYEFWRNPEAPEDDPAAWIASCSIITTAAEEELAPIHPRMPLVLPSDRFDAWLDPSLTEPEAVRPLLEAPAPGRLAVRPVSAAVGNIRNNSAELMAEAEPAGGGTLF